MSVKLYSRFHVPIQLTRILPKGWKIEKVDNWIAEDEDNKFAFQEIKGDGFAIRFQSLLISKPTVFTIDSPGTICFQISTHGTLEYELSGFESSLTVYHRRFNLVSVPSFSAKYKINQPSELIGCELWLTKEYLQRFGNQYPALETFLREVEKGRPVKLFPHSQFASVEMMSLADLISINARDDAASRDWLDVYVAAILEYALSSSGTAKRIKAESKTTKRIYEIVDILHEGDSLESEINLEAGILEISPRDGVKHLQNEKDRLNTANWSLDDFASFAGMSSYKLEKVFNELYNCTVTEYKRQINWQSALTMLLSGSVNLKSISALTGFYTQGNFSRAFKKRFGDTPVKFVQKWAKKLDDFKKSDKEKPGKNLGNGQSPP